VDKNVTVSVKGLLVTGLVLLALAVAYLLGGGGDNAPTAQAAAPEDGAAAAARTVTMTGSGEATAVPDQVVFDVSVRMMRPELEDALAASNQAMDGVLDALEAEGVARKDIQTTGLEMDPVYDYPRYSAPVLKGYRVTQRAAVLVRELKSAGKAVTAAVDSGGNAVRVSDIRLKIGDPEAALATARTQAVKKATAKAQEYADATGQKLGDVMTLREVEETSQSAIDRRNVMYESAAAYSLADMASNLPIQAGRADLGVDVQVVWELAD
jgi:hypothetical protein